MTETDAAAPRERMRPVDPRLLRYASASRGFFVAIGVIAVAQTAVIVAFAWLLTRAITGAIDGMPQRELVETLGALAIVVVARAVLLWAREAAAARAAARVQTQLRTALVDAVGTLGPAWLGTRNSAQLAITAGRGLDALEAYFGRYLPQLVQTVVATPIILAVMWWQDWISGLTVLLTLPLIPLFMVLIGLATRTVQQRQWQTLQRLAARFADTVQGLSTLKVFGRQHRAAASIEQVTETYRRETMKVLRISFLSGFALEFLASISVAIVAVSIGFRLVDGALALSVGLFVLLLAPEAYLPIRQVGVQFHAAAEGVAATDDVFAVLDAARASSRHGAGHASAAIPDGVVRLDGVRVRRGERMLPPVSLEAGPGTVTLVEGPSGAGKSSVFAALRGAAEFDGDAECDGIDVRELAPSSWLAWAGQQPGLVTGTIAENVALGDTAPDEEIVRRALELACADDLEPGRALGVQGAGLSGGQAHRVAVARALYRRLGGRAAVVALDEPSSALDPVTEERLWRSIRSIADDGATVLLISHRTSARAIADRVVRLEPSEVVA
ncbi:thiol reductant ABC exporter subunit CydD [Microbacterium sp. 2FI]|uniref:thiol reductant ABC exporter subunit CydD n=1 Tax=Microbacterium sp. 2FI TaxID=2502193 RepID=UPI0010F9AB9E|nr:thiol reductant ABC exporter subunit CydD [Microbacterium sp. 2FI]